MTIGPQSPVNSSPSLQLQFQILDILGQVPGGVTRVKTLHRTAPVHGHRGWKTVDLAGQTFQYQLVALATPAIIDGIL